jgi:hypothetical protein
MEIKTVISRGQRIAVVQSNEMIISDIQTALDFIASIWHIENSNKIAINKSAVTEDFFNLSTGVAGEIAQKFVNYDCQLAIMGDFSHYRSRALADYMYECNKANHLFFAKNETEAVEFLTR